MMVGAGFILCEAGALYLLQLILHFSLVVHGRVNRLLQYINYFD